MTITVLCERSNGLSVETIAYTSTAFHNEVDGWFEHFHLGNGLVFCRRQTRDEVEDDIDQPAPWYQDETDAPMFFCREGRDGGFESLTQNDIAFLTNMVLA